MRFLLVALLCALSYAQTVAREMFGLGVEWNPDQNVRLLKKNNVPELYDVEEKTWRPVCGYGFTASGANIFCQMLGYEGGEFTQLNQPYQRDSIQIGACINTDLSLWNCTGGDNTYRIGGKFCGRKRPAAISIKCSNQLRYIGPFREYKEYHDKMTSRYLQTGVFDFPMLGFVCRPGIWQGKPNRGLSDHTGAIVGLLAFAIIHKVVFYVDCPFFRSVWEQNNIQWYMNLTHIHHSFVDVDWLEYRMENKGALIDIDSLTERVKRENITTIRSNRGIILKLYQRQEIQPLFKRYHMTLQSAFRDLHDFIFQPTEPVLEVMKSLTAPVSTESQMILLQIRTGDDCFIGTTKMDWDSLTAEEQICARVQFALTQNFIKCAEKIEQNHGGEPMIWYLMSDSKHVKRHVLLNYSDKRQVISPDFFITKNSTEYTHEENVVHLVGEILFGMQSDYFIISQHSGIGRQIAFRSGREYRSTYHGDLDRCWILGVEEMMMDYSWL